MEDEPILHVWIHTDNDLVDLTLTTKTHAPHSTVTATTSEVIHTNKKHPFFTKEAGFLPVAQLKLGMHVLRADGRYGVITGYKLVPGAKVIYNLEVQQDHTFTVGVGQWVVHNSDGPSCAPGTSYQQLSDAASQPDRNGFTRSGRALQKHSARPGGATTWGVDNATSAQLNTPSYVNPIGQDIVDDIVTSPNTSWTSYSSSKYGGQIIEGWLPSGLGARWIITGSLTFMGLLD
jgi:hypothetical protein